MDRNRAWELILNKNRTLFSEGKIHFVMQSVPHAVVHGGIRPYLVKDVAWLSWEWAGADLRGNWSWIAETDIETGDEGSSKYWALSYVNLQTAIY
jgi:hypothetical protein